MVHSYLQFKSNQAKSSKANLKQSQAKPKPSPASHEAIISCNQSIQEKTRILL